MDWMRRAGLVATLIGSLIVAAAAAPVVAVDPAARLVDVRLGSPDVTGTTLAEGDVVTVTQKRGGKRIAQRRDTTDSFGSFEVRLLPIRGGDQLVLRFKGTRVVTVPRMSLAGDPVKDRISGRSPVRNGFVDVSISDVVGSYALGSATLRTFATDAKGRFSATSPGLSGAEGLEMTWKNAAEDQFLVNTAMTAAEVQAGQSWVEAFGRSGTTQKVQLWSTNGRLRGTATVRIKPGFSSGRAAFRARTGARVKARPGDQVRIGRHTGLVLLSGLLTLGPTGASATCFPDGDWVIGTVFGAGAFSTLDVGTADGTGTVSASWVGALPSGTTVRLMCENAAGWVQSMTGFIL